MKLGIGLPSFASDTHAIPPDRFRNYVELADEYNFARAWQIEHLVQSPTYATSMLDPLTTLSLVAGETETLPIGTSVLLLPLRNPVMVAKRVATLQHLASREVTLGIGTGYVEAEFDAVGIPIEERSPRYLEGIELIRRLFNEDEVTFEGEFYSVEDFQLEPNLGQPPQILAGGGGVDTENGRRVVESVKERLLYADGWIAPPVSTAVLEKDWRQFAEYLYSKGRNPDSFYKVALQYLHLVPSSDEEQVRRSQRKIYSRIVGPERSVNEASENWLTGSIEDITMKLAEYEQQGFDEFILYPVAHTPSDLDHQLRLYRKFLLPEYP